MKLCVLIGVRNSRRADVKTALFRSADINLSSLEPFAPSGVVTTMMRDGKDDESLSINQVQNSLGKFTEQASPSSGVCINDGMCGWMRLDAG